MNHSEIEDRIILTYLSDYPLACSLFFVATRVPIRPGPGLGPCGDTLSIDSPNMGTFGKIYELSSDDFTYSII